MKVQKGWLLVLALCLSLLLCGCRTRTNGGREGREMSNASASLTAETQMGESASAEAASESVQENETPDAGENEEMSSQTKENPDASRKEYDENAPAEIVSGTDRLLHAEGEGEGAWAAKEEAVQLANRLHDQAEQTATQTVAAEGAEQRGVSEEAKAAESAMTYFTVLLQDRIGSLFECQRLTVYWEGTEDHMTIHKSSPEHTLIQLAGGYDVSARLLPENLLVDDGWVARKNPGVIVKIVDKSVLGHGADSAGGAKAVYESIRHRKGWAALDAVKNGRILLLSQELLDRPDLQTAALLLIAKTAYPALFSDVDADQALQMLAQEATGTMPTGLYFYCKEE